MTLNTSTSALAPRNSHIPAATYDPSLSVADAARYLNLSVSFLNKARSFGTGPRFCKLQHRVVYRQSDLDAWRDQRAFASTSQYAQRDGG
jgi:predicted DNA-binding transcriptional regulator AlpA